MDFCKNPSDARVFVYFKCGMLQNKLSRRYQGALVRDSRYPRINTAWNVQIPSNDILGCAGGGRNDPKCYSEKQRGVLRRPG